MKILIITTGGTIGSAFDGGSIDVIPAGGCAAAQRYAAEHRKAKFDIISPLNILSESVSADELSTLARVLLTADTSAYDGVIITSGSDNLAHIAAFAALLTGAWELPVFIVAADRVLSDPLSNGYANFSCAVELIGQGSRGVFVPYRNSDGVIYVHDASDICQADCSDDFFSFNGAHAVYEGGSLIERRPYIGHTAPAVFDKAHLPKISGRVLALQPYPMMDYERISADGYDAVLHRLYHSGTLDNIRAEAFLRTLGDVPLYLASLRSGKPVYASTAAMIEAGAIPLFDISPACAYAALLLACAQDRMGIREFMEKI